MPVQIKMAFAALLMSLSATVAPAAEVCRYTGTTDYFGKLDIQTTSRKAGDKTELRVLLKFRATVFFQKVEYFIDEITSWREGELITAAENSRYLFNSKIKRQRWSVFRKEEGAFQAYRVRGKKEEDIKGSGPDMLRHFPIGTFGGDWVGDFRPATENRFSEGDVKALPGLQTPLGFVFYWTRFLKPKAYAVPIYALGKSDDKLTTFEIPAPSATATGLLWKAPVEFGDIRTAPKNPATFFISKDRKLQKVQLKLQSDYGSASGNIQLVGCQEQ